MPTTSRTLVELRVSRQLPRLHDVRLEAERPPDPRDSRLRHARRLVLRTRRPVRITRRRHLAERSGDQGFNLLVRDLPCCPRTRPVHQALQPVCGEPGPPLAHRLPRDTQIHPRPARSTGPPHTPARSSTAAPAPERRSVCATSPAAPGVCDRTAPAATASDQVPPYPTTASELLSLNSGCRSC